MYQELTPDSLEFVRKMNETFRNPWRNQGTKIWDTSRFWILGVMRKDQGIGEKIHVLEFFSGFFKIQGQHGFCKIGGESENLCDSQVHSLQSVMFQILMIRKSGFWAGSFTWNAAKGAAVEGVGAKICEILEFGVGGFTLQNSISGFRSGRHDSWAIFCEAEIYWKAKVAEPLKHHIVWRNLEESYI